MEAAAKDKSSLDQRPLLMKRKERPGNRFGRTKERSASSAERKPRHRDSRPALFPRGGGGPPERKRGFIFIEESQVTGRGKKNGWPKHAVYWEKSPS